MNKDGAFSEEGVETSLLNWFEELDWDRCHASVFDRKWSRKKDDVIYWNLLREKLTELNPEINDDNVEDLISSIARDLTFDNLLDANKKFLDILRKGKRFTVQTNEGLIRKYIKLIDLDNTENNSFVAVNQFRFRATETIIPDIVLLINGIPIVVGELKSLAQEKDCYDAIEDLRIYEKTSPKLFIPTLMNIASDGIDYRYGATGALFKHYYPWKETTTKYEHIENETKCAVFSMFNHVTLLDILHYFVFYGHREGSPVKIIPRYMQYYATNRILARIEKEEHKRGLIWHTQGSGKSYTMFFTAYKAQMTQPVNNPIVLIIVDRDNLNTQMEDDLHDVEFPNFEVAKTINHLEKMLQDSASRTILTTIQKFENVNIEARGNRFIILSDEAHRFMEKKLGSKLDAALPDAFHFGFTGTPVREYNRDTFANFMPAGKDELYLHHYSLASGIQDELILPVYFEIKREVWEYDDVLLSELDAEFDKEVKDLTKEERDKFIRKHVTSTMLAETRPRVRKIVQWIREHYDAKLRNTGYKAMIVTPTRLAAALYKEELDKEMNPNESEVIYSGASSYNDLIGQYFKSSDEIDEKIKAFEKPGEDPQIMIVCDMLLTGFDAPTLKVMYLDRPLHNHTLLQAIARTNRPLEGKHNGLIIDFQYVFENLDEALDYPAKFRRDAAKPSDNLKEDFENALNELLQLFEGIELEDSQEALDKCVTSLSKNPEKRRKFKEKYRYLQDLYETISPDKFLVREDIEPKYKIATQIFIVFMRTHRRSETPEKELKRKTRELLEKHLDVTEIKEDYPVYEISYEHLEMIRDLVAAAKATEIAYATQKHLKGKLGKNVHYSKLSQRVRDVLTDWQRDRIEDQMAARKLEDIEREALDLLTQPAKLGLNEGQFAIYTLIQDQYGDAMKDEDELVEISRQIGDVIDEVDTEFSQWYSNEETLKKIRRGIIKVIVDFDKTESLYKGTDFVSQSVDYLIENEVSNQ